MNIFTPQFLAASADEIAQAIHTDGFFKMEGGLTPEFLDQVLKDVGEHPFEINKNWVSGVYANQQFYVTHMLAVSQAYTDLVTHPKVFEICGKLLGDTFRLKAMRYYETFGKHHMQWHTDNKTDRGFAHIPGLIFIAYLADVTDGEFQYVRGSQQWSGETAYSDYPDALIEEKHGKDIVSFKAPRGTVLVYDTYGIHRARPVKDPKFVRKSMFFQVDSKVESAEPMLINPRFVRSREPHILDYLGFGKPAEYAVYPDTRLDDLPAGRVKWSPFARWAALRLARPIYEAIPLDKRGRIKRLFGR